MMLKEKNDAKTVEIGTFVISKTKSLHDFMSCQIFSPTYWWSLSFHLPATGRPVRLSSDLGFGVGPLGDLQATMIVFFFG